MNAVLRSAHGAWTATDWSEEVRQASLALAEAGSRVVATLLDNGAAFVAIDEAALADGVVHVPLPPFFTSAQVAHAMDAAGVDTLIAAPALAVQWPELAWRTRRLAKETVCVARRETAHRPLPPGTAKVTFTSGTTGQPKGVCLGAAALDAVAQSLVRTLGPLGIERHLSVLPYAVLLENVAGSMAARSQGATLISMPAAAVGLSGSSKFDPAVLDRTVREQQAGSLILLPQMLRAWCAFLATSGQRASGSLRFVAVGGAAVGAPLLGQARSLGIPAFEGYGLSEACSVQSLNLPGADRAGSVGRVLPHGEVRVTATGEIEVRGSLHLGYLGDTESVPPWWPTGDLGHVDDDGYLFIEGRRKNVLITGFGRNVSPEWVETVLASQPAIAQAVVMGDGLPELQAVIWPSPAAGPEPHAAIAQAVERANRGLPDYARVGAWVIGQAAHDQAHGLFTPNGRPVRARVQARYSPLLPDTAKPDPTQATSPISIA